MKTEDVVAECDRCRKVLPLLGSEEGMLCADCLADAHDEDEDEE